MKEKIRLVVGLCLFFLNGMAPTGAWAETIPLPAGLDPAFTPQLQKKQHDPALILPAFLPVPYRLDGVVDTKGRYVLFEEPEQAQPTPGLTCSGFVVSASRFLLGKNIGVEEAAKDRRGDSGPLAPMGEDWDFGWDVIANISEGFTRRLLLPGEKTGDPSVYSGVDRGFDLHSPATWVELPRRFKPGHIYLLSFSKPVTRDKYTLMHYHVGLVWVADAQHIWYYHTSPSAGKVNRRNLAEAGDRASFLKAFANSGKARKMIAVIEVALP